jgi:acetyl esterase/lipase
MKSKTFTFKKIGSLTLKIDVYWSDNKGALPIILYFHGGALIIGDRKAVTKWQIKRLTNAGFMVISADYRLVPESRLPEILEDIKDAYNWIREVAPHFLPVDPKRIAIMGHSAGGYLTLLAGAYLNPHPVALVSFYAPSDLTTKFYCTPDPNFLKLSPISRKEALRFVGKQPIASSPKMKKREQFFTYCQQNAQWTQEITGLKVDLTGDLSPLYQYSPAKCVTSEYPPTMLLIGTKDSLVLPEQVEIMYKSLIAAGVDAKCIMFPNGDHGFDGQGLKNPEINKCINALLDFLLEHCGMTANLSSKKKK